MSTDFPTFIAGLVLGLSLIMALGPQNAHLLRMGLQRQHVALTAGICMLSDILLISIGVLGLAQLGGLSDTLMSVLVGAGALFLLLYGWKAFRRFLHPPTLAVDNNTGPSRAPPMTRRQAALTALAFSWLNPHAWLDTAVLIGTASLAYGAAAVMFGVGAAVGSVLWFGGLALAALWLGLRLNSPQIWRVLDGLVALMMWGTALWLLRGLL